VKLVKALLIALFMPLAAFSSIAAPEVKKVDFSRGDGPYREDDFARDFGRFSPENSLTSIENQALCITFPKGKKIEGLRGALVSVAPRDNYVLEFRIKYPKNFEDGLHGKQFGLTGGAGYTGGRGEEARTNGDGWSVRLQFDAHGGKITHQLYVYHTDMKGKYGESLGTEKQRITLCRDQWHTIRLKVTMQSLPDKADGLIEVWEGGVRRIKIDRIHFVRKKSGCEVSRIALEAFCGGAGIIPTHDNTVRVDDICWWSDPPDPIRYQTSLSND
jgi:hypothetical protein